MTRASPVLALELDLREHFCEFEMGAKARENTLSEMPALSFYFLFLFFCAPCSLRDENADPINNSFTVVGAISGRHIPWAETLSARITNTVITSTSSYNVDQGTPTRNRGRTLRKAVLSRGSRAWRYGCVQGKTTKCDAKPR